LKIQNPSALENQVNQEKVTGIVERVTYHNSENGWSVLKVSTFREPERLTTVLIHQSKVFAGATMEFFGNWVQHPKHGHQFKAQSALEKKPASSAALEKYLGSGLIKGVGPVIAKKIVKHFQDRTMEVFEKNINELMHVPGIASKKLEMIKLSWEEHKAIRDVMLFLQGYGISTLFAVKIFKTYGDKSISKISENPYCLARDIYGIGFFSADRIALKMGFEKRGTFRIEAGIKHVLSASREQGHCYLTEAQICEQTTQLLSEPDLDQNILDILISLYSKKEIQMRILNNPVKVTAYYSKTLFYDELICAQKVKKLIQVPHTQDVEKITQWVSKYCEKQQMSLSPEQQAAVVGISKQNFSILTGGPGCGKTTTTKVLVKLLLAMKKTVLLAAPTGRASQRMTEVIGMEAKTLHRLLEWTPQLGSFKKNEEEPLMADFLIVDECSMLDISLAASVLKAVPSHCQVLFIGDPDQLPSVGAGNVLFDLLQSPKVPHYRLTQIFRQAEKSSIIRFAHTINAGTTPKIESPLAHPKAFSEGIDCLFLDSDEATQEQVRFIQKAKSVLQTAVKTGEPQWFENEKKWLGLIKSEGDQVQVERCYLEEGDSKPTEFILKIPQKFQHVDLVKLNQTQSQVSELFEVIKNVHPWSSLHFGLTAVDSVVRLYTKTLREWLGPQVEVQVLTPQVRGTLGTVNLNAVLQEAQNPPSPGKKEYRLGEKIYRVGDRVIQTRNNYDLGVFNGDIGRILEIDTEEGSIQVQFGESAIIGNSAREISFSREDLLDLSLAYAITIHKSQGSEFEAVIIPVMTQHFNMLFRNLIYTGLTRAKKLAIFVGSRKAFSMAIRQVDHRQRQTALTALVQNES